VIRSVVTQTADGAHGDGVATNDKRKQSLYFPEEMLAPAAMVFRRAVEVAVQEVQSSDDADRSCSVSVLLRTCG